ncbi:MAG: histidinol dehydrogenase [Thermoplasmata archaeon]|jgi:histidinol dehydrogenase|nr:histidinol dehydrogenase [Candidatus Sysuiplasma jiujiangense]
MSGNRLECRSAEECVAAASQLREAQRPGADIDAIIERIFERVRNEGDRSLFDLTEEFDGVKLKKLRLDTEEMKALASDVDGEVLEALKMASSNIRQFHLGGHPAGVVLQFDGSRIERKYVPLGRVGIYVPGGKYAYSSTVLMAAIPARIAGVTDMVLFTPPDKDGKRLRYVAAACLLSGISSIVTVGGAQAIAAMAYGTESIRKVDMIVGPGNSYVAKAKAAVSSLGLTGIDSIAGPTEILALADRSAGGDEDVVAYELLAQMEHGSGASAVLCSDSAELIDGVIGRMHDIVDLARRSVLTGCLQNFTSVLVSSPELMEAFAEEYAPEHLFAVGDEAERIAEGVRNSGSVFIGRCSSVAFGDYISGTNHILPTMGTARFSSPLQVTNFMKVVERQRLSRITAEKLSAPGSKLAESEGLFKHAACMKLRGRMPGTEVGSDE